jgi:hypothetical protein
MSRARTFLPVAQLAALLAIAASVSMARASESAAASKAAANKSAAELLPSSAIAYAEIARPKDFLATILDHPLREKLEQTDAYRKAVLSPQLLQLAAVVSLVETQIGTKWRPALEAITGDGIHVAFDAARQGAVLLVRSSDPAVREKLQKALIAFAQGEAKRKGGRSPIASETYRDLTIHQAGEARFASVGPWFIASNQAALVKETIDRCVGESGDSKSLASDAEFKAARSSATVKPAAWAFVRVAALRDASGAKKLLTAKSDNPAAEILIGGLVSTFGKTPYVTAALHVGAKGLDLSVAAPYDATWVPASRNYYFGPAGKGSAPPLLAPKNTVLSLAAYRDVGGMWEAAADLFDENANAQLAQADSNLSNLFGGRDFSQDVLGSFGPEWQIVAARQDYGRTGMPAPTLKLPAFALGLRLKDPAKVQEDLAVSFQSIVGFFNIAGSMERYPRLKISTHRRDGGTIIATNYLLDKERAKDQQLFYNFSPSLAMIGNRLFLASTRQLAEELFDAHRKAPAKPATGKAIENTRAQLDAKILADVLSDNRDQFVSQNMLKKGQKKAQAEQEIDTLLSLLRWVKSSSIRLATEKNTLRFDLGIALDTDGK